MDFFKIFDAYSLRARIAPAFIAIAPALVAVLLLIPWKSFEVPKVIATGGGLILVFAISDFARWRGRNIELKVFAKLGGKPSVTMFRRNDPTIDDIIKDRFRSFLATKLGVCAPSLEAEQADQITADSFYEQCGVWLRQNTRDNKKFNLLFNENITYGFRRNLYSVKWLALALNLGVMTACLLVLWKNNWGFGSAFLTRIYIVFMVTIFQSIYILLSVRETAVLDAARAYGRELILACEAFLAVSLSPKESIASRKRRKSGLND